MHYVVVRDCLLDRLYAKGERVCADTAGHWPEHVEAVGAYADNSETSNQEPDSKNLRHKESTPNKMPCGNGGLLHDGTPLTAMTRKELRAWAAVHYPGAVVPWGRKADMAEAVRRLDRGR